MATEKSSHSSAARTFDLREALWARALTFLLAFSLVFGIIPSKGLSSPSVAEPIQSSSEATGTSEASTETTQSPVDQGSQETAPLSPSKTQKATKKQVPAALSIAQDGWVATSASAAIGTDAGLIVVLDPSAGKTTYPATSAGLRAALGYIASNGDGGTWLLYIGNDVTDNETATGSSVELLSAATANIDTLVITGDEADVITNNPATADPTGYSELIMRTGATTLNVNSNLVIRNMAYSLGGTTGADGYNVYMNGHDLIVGGGSWHTAAQSWYGGGQSGEITADSSDGSADMVIYSTGGTESNFIGGMYTGTLTGDASVTVHNTSGAPGDEFNIYGSGYGTGTGATAQAHLVGNATITIDGMGDTNGGLGRLLGGGGYGSTTGKITINVSGPGRFSNNVPLAATGDSATSAIIGGWDEGNVGTTDDLRPAIEDMESTREALAYTDDYIIKTNVDTSAYR